MRKIDLFKGGNAMEYILWNFTNLKLDMHEQGRVATIPTQESGIEFI